jgi:predicted nucleic acid-binding protein
MWFLPEEHSGHAFALLASGNELAAPDLLRVEVASALLKAVRRRQVKADYAANALLALAPPALKLFPTLEHLDSAFAIAERHGGSLYDALYISVARLLDAPLVTNDSRLATVAKSAGVEARLISRRPPV